MRDFFINGFERLIGVIMVVAAIAIVLGAIVSASQAPGAAMAVVSFLAVLVVGGLYLILMGGAAYLGLGIYHNTRRAADALERQAAAPRP